MPSNVHALAFAAASLLIGAEPSAEVTVEVGPLKNLKGELRCGIFNQPEGFPTDPKRALARDHHKPEGNTVVCRFAGLAAGTYAVSVLHDEDADGEMATNFIGVPTEGYGVSNNKIPSMSAPKYEDARFTLAAGEKKTLKVSVHY